jgi:hypothetical protein
MVLGGEGGANRLFMFALYPYLTVKASQVRTAQTVRIAAQKVRIAAQKVRIAAQKVRIE